MRGVRPFTAVLGLLFGDDIHDRQDYQMRRQDMAQDSKVKQNYDDMKRRNMNREC